jgi:hypothetical protein
MEPERILYRRWAWFTLVPITLIVAAYTHHHRPVGTAQESTLELRYYQTLDNWVHRGAPLDQVQDTVVATCGKLVFLTASSSEQRGFVSTDQEEFHFRVDVCMKMTVNRVHPQPEFEDREMVSMICDESGIELFSKLCVRSGLR